MRTILATILILLLLLPVSAIGEIQTVTHTVKQAFGGSQSPDDARIAAIAKAKREALEMAGVYIESLTVVKNRQVDKDEILALSAGVLKAEVVSQKNYVSGDAFGIDVVVKVVVDTSVLESRVKKLLQDRIHLDQLSQARKKEKGLLNEVAILEKKNRRLMAGKESSMDLKKQFQEASQGLTAVEWFDKAASLTVNGKFSDPPKAVEYLNEAISLNPEYAEAYGNRGNAYADLGQYQLAIKDYNEVIRLKPDDAMAYYNRGLVYSDLKQYRRAIEDYNKAIGINPEYAEAYNNRGAIYNNNLGQYQRAIEDYNKVIRLKPNDAMAHFNRGFAYAELGLYRRAIEDYNKAILLKPADALSSYNNRGIAYLLQGNKNLGCRDAQKSCELGDCKLLELGACR